MKLLSSIKLGNYFFICSDASCHVYKWALAPATKIQFIKRQEEGTWLHIKWIAHFQTNWTHQEKEYVTKRICPWQQCPFWLAGSYWLTMRFEWQLLHIYAAFSKIAQSFCKTTLSEVWVANVPTDVFFSPLLWRTHCHKISNDMVTNCHKTLNCDRNRQEVCSTLWMDCCSVAGNFVYFNWIAGFELVSRSQHLDFVSLGASW